MRADGSNNRLIPNTGGASGSLSWRWSRSILLTWKWKLGSIRPSGDRFRTYDMETVGLPRFPSWSPDASKIMFVAETGEEADIHTISRRGGEHVRITSDCCLKQFPVYSPSGAYIAYIEDGNIVIINADGSEESRIDHTANLEAPDWGRVSGPPQVSDDDGISCIAEIIASIWSNSVGCASEAPPRWS